VVPSAGGSPSQVAAVLRAFGQEVADRCSGPIRVAEQLDDLLPDLAEVGAEFGQGLRRHTFALAKQGQQDVLGVDEALSELHRVPVAELQHGFGAECERDLAVDRLVVAPSDCLYDHGPDGRRRDPDRDQPIPAAERVAPDQSGQKHGCGIGQISWEAPDLRKHLIDQVKVSTPDNPA
jgi:hypothetical protein